MSFDIFVQPIGDAPDSDAVRRVLEPYWEAPPDATGYVSLARGDVESDLFGLTSNGPINSLMFSGPSPATADLIVEVARVGELVILPVGSPPCVATNADASQLPAEMIEALGDAVVVADGRDLLRVIESS